mmetsp:Transcript_8043/g.18735  ORF Transcript_8043/g.18735 Transcript_8043/m.18735 type:complete len:320 (+) Transcript_8043:380-1339(+)
MLNLQLKRVCLLLSDEDEEGEGRLPPEQPRGAEAQLVHESLPMLSKQRCRRPLRDREEGVAEVPCRGCHLEHLVEHLDANSLRLAPHKLPRLPQRVLRLTVRDLECCVLRVTGGEFDRGDGHSSLNHVQEPRRDRRPRLLHVGPPPLVQHLLHDVAEASHDGLNVVSVKTKSRNRAPARVRCVCQGVQFVVLGEDGVESAHEGGGQLMELCRLLQVDTSKLLEEEEDARALIEKVNEGPDAKILRLVRALQPHPSVAHHAEVVSLHKWARHTVRCVEGGAKKHKEGGATPRCERCVCEGAVKGSPKRLVLRRVARRGCP